MNWYHVTPIENLESIKQHGLKMYQVQTSDQPDPEGHYISNDWIELITSGTYPEIFRYDEIAILRVDTSTLVERMSDDPEYDSIDDDLLVQVIKCDVPNHLLFLEAVINISECPFNKAMSAHWCFYLEHMASIYPTPCSSLADEFNNTLVWINQTEYNQFIGNTVHDLWNPTFRLKRRSCYSESSTSNDHSGSCYLN